MRSKLLAIALLLAGGMDAQPVNQLVRFQRPYNGTISLANQVSNPVINVGQGSHLMVIFFTGAVADVTPLQVRLEASYTCPDPPPGGTCASGTWFPISTDITSAIFVSGIGAYSMVKANGAFPNVRVNSILATPGAQAMDVRYTGAPYPIANIFFAGDRFIPGSPSGAYDKATFVICNGAPCVTGTNLTNSYIVVAPLAFRACYIFAKTAPTGASLIVDVNKNGTSIFGATKLVFPAGGTTVVTQATFATFTVTTLDLLTVDIDQIGSTIAGQDVSVTCVLDLQ